MSSRLDPRPLLRGVGAGLRKRRHVGVEEPDVTTRRVLIWAPIVVACLMIGFRIQLEKAEELLAGAAFLIASLLAAFAIVAGWRDRILARDRSVDQVALRALDEATAHILFSTIMSVIATACFGFMANYSPDGKYPKWCDVLLDGIGISVSAVGAAAFAYIMLTLWIVVNLLWDAYQRTGKIKTPTS